MDPERLTELFYSELSDEAATQIADFFHELALCFESGHLDQILRHQRAVRPQDNDDSASRDRFSTPGDPF